MAELTPYRTHQQLTYSILKYQQECLSLLEDYLPKASAFFQIMEIVENAEEQAMTKAHENEDASTVVPLVVLLDDMKDNQAMIDSALQNYCHSLTGCDVVSEECSTEIEASGRDLNTLLDNLITLHGKVQNTIISAQEKLTTVLASHFEKEVMRELSIEKAEGELACSSRSLLQSILDAYEQLAHLLTHTLTIFDSQRGQE